MDMQTADFPTTMGIAPTVRSEIEQELRYLRGQGVPLKAGFEQVARIMRVTARRIRQYHENLVAEEAVTAREWLAAVELRNRRRRDRIAAARALLAQEASHEPHP